MELVEYRFYAALAHAAAYDASPPERREMHLSSLRHHHHELTIRCTRNPANFADRLTLLAAEIARIEGRELEAERLYEESIRLAREAGFVQIEAIAARVRGPVLRGARHSNGRSLLSDECTRLLPAVGR